MTEWIDAHTHLDSNELNTQLPEVFLRAEKAGVTKMLLVNSEATELSFQKTRDCLNLSTAISRFLSFGVHPHHALLYDDRMEVLLLRALESPGVVALGEIGLDFYYDNSPRETQISVLNRQLRLSLERNMPVVIHCRDAYETLAQVLRTESPRWRGMIHCYTGTPQEAETLLELGFYISFSGIVTFRNADVLRDSARFVPMDRMLIETDAPYLAPAPHRGKVNEPAFVAETGRFLAKLKQKPEEDFSRIIAANFSALFGV